MTTIVTRAGKGSPLTNVEVDANFTNLNNDKLEKTGGTITANSTDPALKITQTGSGDALRVEDDSGDTTPFVIDQNGNVAIGATGAANYSLLISKNVTGAATAADIRAQGTIQSDVTNLAIGFTYQPITAASAFTCGNIQGFRYDGVLLGAGSTVTNQYGFFVESSTTGATNNYGFYGNIPAGTGRWNFYAAGTADNYFAGGVGVGVVTAGFKLSVAQTAATHAVASLYNADATATYNTDLQINNGNVVGNALISRRTNGELWMYTSAAHPIALWTNNAERMRIDSAGNVFVGALSSVLGEKFGVNGGILGTASSAAVTAYSATGQTSFMLHVNDAAIDQKKVEMYLATNGNCAIRSISDTYTSASSIISAVRGSGITWSTVSLNGDKFQVDASGNSRVVVATGGLGYGTGAVGTVTQATSKSTAVTLNKPTGQITMNNAALAAGDSVSFALSNTTIAETDVLLITAGSLGGNYRVEASSVSAGSATIRVTNISAGSLSEALTINFAVIKGSSN